MNEFNKHYVDGLETQPSDLLCENTPFYWEKNKVRAMPLIYYNS